MLRSALDQSAIATVKNKRQKTTRNSQHSGRAFLCEKNALPYSPKIFHAIMCASGAAGSALAFGSEGRGFDTHWVTNFFELC